MEAVIDELNNYFGLTFFIYYLGLNFTLTRLEWSKLIGGGEG